MKAVKIKNGIIHISYSKAVCPHCGHRFPFESLDKKLRKSENVHIKTKCKCRRFVGITSNIRGDLVAYKL